MSNDNSQSKTEQPTQRKLEKSRAKGQTAYSADLTGGLVLLAASILLAISAISMWESLKLETARCLYGLGDVDAANLGWQSMLLDSSWRIVQTGMPIAGLAFAMSFLSGGLLTGFRVTPEAFKLDLDKLNPTSGFSRLFSSRSLVRGAVAILKLTVISAILYVIMKMQHDQIGWSTTTSLDQTTELTIRIVLGMLLGVSGGLTIIGVADFGFQKWKHLQDLKMSHQEIRDEQKEDDGDPQVRARIKRLQREMGERSMIQDVASATVLVTNPTHFAVALQYSGDSMNAPIVVAKGKDFLAQKIIKVADMHGVLRIERKPLARALYHSVSIGSEIPLELYQDVAEVLSYVQGINSIAGRQAPTR